MPVTGETLRKVFSCIRIQKNPQSLLQLRILSLNKIRTLSNRTNKL